jgi:O-antigen ligase
VLSALVFLINSGFLDKIIGKIFLDGGGTSSSQRLEVFQLAIQRFSDNPLFGLGLGYTSSIGEMSPINWYLVLATNGGVFALLSILIFHFLNFKISLELRSNYGVLPAIGIVCGILALLTTSTFFIPIFWIAIIFINKMKHNYD